MDVTEDISEAVRESGLVNGAAIISSRGRRAMAIGLEPGLVEDQSYKGWRHW